MNDAIPIKWIEDKIRTLESLQSQWARNDASVLKELLRQWKNANIREIKDNEIIRNS